MSMVVPMKIGKTASAIAFSVLTKTWSILTLLNKQKCRMSVCVNVVVRLRLIIQTFANMTELNGAI